jgi:predicted nucleic acid-binding protein
MIDPSASTSRDFFDSNILVYAYDDRDHAKRVRARDLLAGAMESETGAVSAQVLGEFFNTVTRRIPDALSDQEAEGVIAQVAILPVVELDLSLVQRAIGTCRRYQISYWDALIVAAAERAGCSRIISEDLNPGQLYNGIPVVNPFE